MLHSYTEVLTHSVSVFGDGAFGKVIRVRIGQEDGTLAMGLVVCL